MRHLTAGQIWGQMWDPQLLITLPRLHLPLAGIYTCAQLCVRSALAAGGTLAQLGLNSPASEDADR